MVRNSFIVVDPWVNFNYSPLRAASVNQGTRKYIND